MNRLLAQIKRYIRKLIDYARRNPMKLVMLVIMPLITGGALADLLRRFGVRLPPSVAAMVGGKGKGGYGGSGRGEGMAGGVQGLMKIAGMFV